LRRGRDVPKGDEEEEEEEEEEGVVLVRMREARAGDEG